MQVTLPGADISPDTSPIAANSVRTRVAGQNIRMLFSREAPFVGQMKLSDDSFTLRLSSEGGLSKLNYFSVGGKFSDQLALTFDQGSATQIRDDPKVFGRSARGG